jgi:hypothetical protein
VAWPTVWENLGDGLAVTSFYRIGLSANNPGYVIGGAQDNSTYYYDTQSWTNLFGGDGMECMIDPNDPNIIYGSSQNGWLSKSTDGGATISNDNSGLTYSILNSGTEQGEWTTPFAFEPKNPGVLYGAFGNLWHTDGDDRNWVRISDFEFIPQLNSPTVSTAMAISPSDPGYIYLAKRPYPSLGIRSQLWMTPNGGTSWRNVSAGLPDSLYLTYIAPHAIDPNTAWVTCGSFYGGVKVFKTTDAGATWTNISRNLPNLPVNCIVHEAGSPNNTVYVGTDIGVYYTNDLMTGWSPFNRNLPNVIVDELEIQYQSKKLYAATFGRGIWVSDLADGTSGVAHANLPLASTEVSVEPNPAPGDFTLRLKDVPAAGEVTVDIVDVTGRNVHSQTLAATAGEYVHRFDLDLPYGLYFVRVTRGTSTRVARFTVVR